MSTITLGEILTLTTLVVGLIVQYIALIKSFGERITRLEAVQDVFTKRFEKDIDSAFDLIRDCREYKPITRETHPTMEEHR